ncbi:hypothetical protein AB6A40_008332 [Gnathostoma spinigerum]|uniref:Endoplasmic reticulum transmembrane protein n=1 Tax=Gnathostoma spinigerum TaxID=75299 RepID=A0ABD6ENS9_9BILA
MSLQWTAVALILYVEIAIVLLLLLPWIRPSLWNKLFKSRLLKAVERFGNVYFVTILAVLTLLFFDAIREVRKYNEEIREDIARITVGAESAVHMRLFRAQRNLYVSGFALLFSLIIKRLVALIQRNAQLEAAAEAAMKQAESATKAAKSLMSDDGENETIKDLRRELDEVSKELKSAQNDRDAMKEQSLGLQKEYDNVCEKLKLLENASGDKKTE